MHPLDKSLQLHVVKVAQRERDGIKITDDARVVKLLDLAVNAVTIAASRLVGVSLHRHELGGRGSAGSDNNTDVALAVSAASSGRGRRLRVLRAGPEPTGFYFVFLARDRDVVRKPALSSKVKKRVGPHARCRAHDPLRSTRKLEAFDKRPRNERRAPGAALRNTACALILLDARAGVVALLANSRGSLGKRDIDDAITFSCSIDVHKEALAGLFMFAMRRLLGGDDGAVEGYVELEATD